MTNLIASTRTDEYTVNSKREMLDAIERVASGDDPNIDFVDPLSGDVLSISIKEGLALVRFTSGTLNPPYLSASSSTRRNGEDAYFEFLIGDTPTPVPADRCLELQTMRQIASYYFDERGLPNWVDWKVD